MVVLHWAVEKVTPTAEAQFRFSAALIAMEGKRCRASLCRDIWTECWLRHAIEAGRDAARVKRQRTGIGVEELTSR